jgi:transcriptional regulator with XRE-family HTH domain
MALLKIQPEDCSVLSKVILKHMQDNRTSLREVSKAAGITHPSLRRICLGRENLTDSMLRKLSKVLKIHPVELYFLAYGESIKALAPNSKDKRFKPILDGIDRIAAKAQFQTPFSITQ